MIFENLLTRHRAKPNDRFRSPILALGLASRSLRSAVEVFSEHMLRQWKTLIHCRQKTLREKPASAVLIRFTLMRCIFCGKLSKRRAFFFNMLTCCTACDRREWPNKIHFYAAAHKYGLDHDDLLLLGTPKWPAVKWTASLNPSTCNAMFLESDVERRAHHVRNRKAAKKALKAAKKARRVAEVRRAVKKARKAGMTAAKALTHCPIL